MRPHAAHRKNRRSGSRSAISLIREDEAAYSLPGLCEPRVGSLTQVSKLNGGFKDSAFADNKSRPIHRWIPWIAGFSSEFVRDAFSQYLPAKAGSAVTVLDPFCGVGTTLVEGQLNGYDTVGFEINPYAALAARSKVETFASSKNTCSMVRASNRSGRRRYISTRVFRSSDDESNEKSCALCDLFAGFECHQSQIFSLWHLDQ